MAVCRGRHPEKQLRAQQGGEVLVKNFLVVEDASDVDKSRAHFGFVFCRAWRSGGLAEVFLRQAQPVLA